MMVELLSGAVKALVVVTTTAYAVTSGLVPLVSPWTFGAHEPAPVVSQEPSLAALIEQLDDGDAVGRAMAACRIGRLRGADVTSARDALIALLGDDTPVEPRLCRPEGWRWGRNEDSSPAREAAVALERVGVTAIDPLIDVLDQAGAVAREHAALALGLIESDRAVDALADLLDDDTPAVRARAAWALGLIESSAAVGALSGAIGDEDPRVREQAAWALGIIESSDAVATLIAALGDAEADVREQAAWALGMIESSAAVDGLVGTLERDADADVREQAAWALGMIESAAAVEGLIAALGDEHASVREQAAWALGMIEDGRAVGALTEALEDDDADVRRQVLWALVRCIEHSDAEVDYEDLAEKLRVALRRGGA